MLPDPQAGFKIAASRRDERKKGRGKKWKGWKKWGMERMGWVKLGGEEIEDRSKGGIGRYVGESFARPLSRSFRRLWLSSSDNHF